ncbi:hypothetical protein C9F11_37500 [Streptomyces sp. YIM 121038]|uniref:hypothetical protein n=1 Tax=Streptomyces sp. YIM 121038 TaxID=2136401 RepID=UPI001110CC84|nr:hypothetical protein [Streptomyces sp. YIM 121038]QCX81083.1 hypothetical protein C9F11_37500 [Streptomyces sp. YIM 121038]
MTTCPHCTTNDLPHGGFLCDPCVRATSRHLLQLPTLWSALEIWLAPGRGAPFISGRTPRAEAPLPLREEVLDLRAEGGIVGVLEDWRAAVHDARGMAPPPRAVSLEHRVAIAARALDGHLDWIARWYAAPDLATDIRTLVGRAYAVIQPGRDPDEPQYLGRCIATDTTGAVCGRPLHAYPDRAVQCDWCLCVYTPDTWLALRHYQPGRGQGMAA